MIVAFTGTRHGMTPAQQAAFRTLMGRLRPGTFRHGLCKGADEEASLLMAYFDPRPTIIGHPAMSTLWESGQAICDWRELPKDYLVRNREMVDQSGCLVAAPQEDERQRRGGTWYTIGYAEGKKPVYVIRPGGFVVLIPPAQKWTYENAVAYVKANQDQGELFS
jgi:hypothetical protein